MSINKNNNQVVTRESILSANIKTHRAEAEIYDSRHGELFNSYAQAEIQRVINKGLTSLREASDPEITRELYALDCGCGTGNVTIKLVDADCKVDAVDISAEMLAIMGSKLRLKYRGRYKSINEDIDSFLELAAPGKYHAITFSSALHHVPDYGETFSKAIRILKRPGIIFVLHEPLPADKVYISTYSQLLRKIDRFVWKYMGKILRKKGPGESISNADAELTDFHVRRGGVNPDVLFEIVEKNNGEIIDYLIKSENMRYCWSAWLDNFFGLRKDNYHLIVLFKE